MWEVCVFFSVIFWLLYNKLAWNQLWYINKAFITTALEKKFSDFFTISYTAATHIFRFYSVKQLFFSSLKKFLSFEKKSLENFYV